MKNLGLTLVGVAVAFTLLVATPASAQTQSIADLMAIIDQYTAQLALLQGGAPATGVAPVPPLTIGSAGAEVTALQDFLIMKGFLTMPAGVAKGTFGNLTQAALAAWQTANGVTPALGYYGSITAAKMATMMGGTVLSPIGGGTTCPAGFTCNPTVPATPCPAGFTCTPIGGGTTPTPDTGLTGSAGSVTITQTSTDVEDEVLTGETGKVLGFKVEASGSDVSVSNVRVKFTAAVDSSASDRLTSYADEIVILADGEEVGSLDASDFSRDSSGVYSASIPVSQIVKMSSAERVVFHVGFRAGDSIDSDDDGSANDWTALFVSLRYTDAEGVVLTDSTTGVSNAGVYVNRVSASTDVKLRMAEGSNNPKTSNIKVPTSGTTDVTLAEFTLKAEGADMYFDQLRASTTISGTTNVSDIASDFYLMRGSSRLAEVAGSTGTSQALTFSLDNTEELSSGDTEIYKIVAKVKAIASTNTTTTFGGGDTITASTSATVWNINAKADSDGKSVTERAGSVTTYTQTLYNEGIQVTKVSDSFTLLPNDTSANVAGEFKITLRVTNFGSNDVYIPLNSLATTSTSVGSTKGIAFGITDGTTATTSTVADATVITGSVARVTGGVEKTNSVLISGGSSADFVLTTSLNPTPAYTGTRQYRIQVWSIGHATTDTATAATIVDTTPVEDFRTAFQTIQN
ncbi:MAG: peptidoglycan-binding domain-containing protein [Patescibacteria group bacterium]